MTRVIALPQLRRIGDATDGEAEADAARLEGAPSYVAFVAPGMLAAAPDRTDTSSGLAGSPKRLPVSASTFAQVSPPSRLSNNAAGFAPA